jgi:hypothetical protein
MQLEPTGQDRGCRVFDFLDSSPSQPSPARLSGQIFVGDVIVSVNGVALDSYDSTIAMLKSGGRREIVFRPGTDEDAYEGYFSEEEGDDVGGPSSDDDEDEDDKEIKKREKKGKKEKKVKKEKKQKKEKDEKKEKDDRKKDKKDSKKK